QDGRISRLDQDGFKERRRDKRGPPSRRIVNSRPLRATHKGTRTIALGLINVESIRRLHGLKMYHTAHGLTEIPNIRKKVILDGQYFLGGKQRLGLEKFCEELAGGQHI